MKKELKEVIKGILMIDVPDTFHEFFPDILLRDYSNDLKRVDPDCDVKKGTPEYERIAGEIEEYLSTFTFYIESKNDLEEDDDE